MRRGLLAAVLLSAAPARAEMDRFFVVASDFVQALHKCHWASQVDVEPHRPLVSLVRALDEQVARLNEARILLLKHREEPIPEARRAVAGLLNGLNMLTLASTQDIADINAVADRWEISQRMQGRRDDRREAVEVMAAAAGLFREALTMEVERRAGRKKVRARKPRLSTENAASLANQIDLFFGDDLLATGKGAEPPPLVGAALVIHRACREAAVGAPQKSP